MMELRGRWDMGRVARTGLPESLAGADTGVIEVMDSNPIDDEDACEEERKLYAPGIGEVADTAKVLVEVTGN